jgi:hypothetical protein
VGQVAGDCQPRDKLRAGPDHGAAADIALQRHQIAPQLGILIPPDGYLQGVRELCDRFGILLICDEVMTGFGHTGRWFAVDHWGVVPDLITLAKGLTSSYVPLGAVGMRPKVAAYFDDHVFYGGLTYNSHPLGCAAALGAIQAYEEDDMVGNAQRMGAVLQRHHKKLQERHPCVGATRSIGLFGALELVRDHRTLEPLAPFNGTSPEMKAIGQALLDAGLYTFVRWNTIMTNPPLCITEAQLDEAFEILDSALEIGDRAVKQLGESQLGRDLDRLLDALRHRAATGVEGVRALRRLALVLGAAGQRVAHANPLDDEHLLVEVDLAFGFRRKPALARVDPARLQRATQGAGESTGRGGDDVVERGRVVLILAGRRAVVLTNLVVGSEEHGVGLRRQERATNGTVVPDDPDSRDVLGLVG